MLDQLIDSTIYSLQERENQMTIAANDGIQREKQKRISKFKLVFCSSLFPEIVNDLIEKYSLTYKCDNHFQNAYAEMLFEQQKITIEYDSNMFRIVWDAPIETQKSSWLEPSQLQQSLLECLAVVRLTNRQNEESKQRFLQQFSFSLEKVCTDGLE